MFVNAFSDVLIYCVCLQQSIVGHNIYMPLDHQLSNLTDVVCFKSVNFGVSAVITCAKCYK